MSERDIIIIRRRFEEHLEGVSSPHGVGGLYYFAPETYQLNLASVALGKLKHTNGLTQTHKDGASNAVTSHGTCLGVFPVGSSSSVPPPLAVIGQHVMDGFQKRPRRRRRGRGEVSGVN